MGERAQRLTAKVVEAEEGTGSLRFLWDRDLKGFGLKVSATGRKVFLVQYRMGGRGFPTKRYTIGADGSPWTAKTARAEAERLLHMVGLGQDPAETAQQRAREQVDLRFDNYAQRFLDLYAAPKWAPRTFTSHASNIRRWVVPVLGPKTLPKISRQDITKVLDQVPPGRPALPRNLFALMRTMFNWAIERGDIEKSPMQGMRAPRHAPERHHILADEELVVVAAVAPELGPTWGNLIHLLLLTGQRLREVSEMDWREVNRSAAEWIIPRERTKNGREQIVPLNGPAMRVLDELAAGERWPRKGFVFSHVDGRPVSGFSRMKARFDKLLAPRGVELVRPWRLHDLRRTVATNMQRLGVRFEVTEAILNHVSTTQAGVAGVYQRHDWADEKREALCAWGDKVIAMIDSYQASRREPAPASKVRKNRHGKA